DRGAQKVPLNGHYDINVWVELHNPMPANDSVSSATGGNRDCVARLFNGTNAVYQVVLAKNGINTTAILQNRANVTGDPTSNGANTVWATVTAYGADPTKWTVQPMPANNLATNNRFGSVPAAGTPGGNTGFYVLGPDPNFTVGINPPPVLPGPTFNS